MKLDRVIGVRNKKTIYRDGDQCVKIFNISYTKADILNEALNQARLEETGLNIPKVLEVKMVDGQWAIVSEYIKGKTLARLMSENPEKLDEYLELFVDLQIEVADKKSPHLHTLKDRMSRRLAETELDATTRYDLHSRLENMPKQSGICHGDFNPTNIIISEDGTPFIIDWSHATQGNASADAAISYLLFRLEGDNITAKRYLEIYCEKTGTSKDFIKKWIPIVAASQSVRVKTQQREELLSWVNGLDIE